MPIVYIHGVKVRSDAHGKELVKPVLKWIAPKGADASCYIPIYWGVHCEKQFRWSLASRPPTELLGHGAGSGFREIRGVGVASNAIFELPNPPQSTIDDAVIGGDTLSTSEQLLPKVPQDHRADFVASLYLVSQNLRADSEGRVWNELDIAGALAVAAADVAARWDSVVGQLDDDAGAAALAQEVDDILKADPLVAHGGPGIFDKLGEYLRRAVAAPGDVVSTLFAEGRPVANDFVANFLGDVLTYLHTRDLAFPQPSPILETVLAGLRQAWALKKKDNEKLIVLTHSMGGQLFYDAINTYAAKDPQLAGIEIDHWVSFGSQVSFFAELGLFRNQPATRGPTARLPRPAAVKAWTNFFDPNDPVGFRMKAVFADVTDEKYNTGYGLALAHTGFLTRPTFFGEISKAVGKL